MSQHISFFRKYFVDITRHSPFPWQETLFDCLIRSDWPELVNLPTGAGKTYVLHIWLLALAWSIRTGEMNVPRRLAWVVNRRVVVDQVSDEVENLEHKLSGLPELAAILRSVSMSGMPLAISTLRGQRADNGAWRRDPSTPAVMIGTVDMVGSRVVFRGYRSGPYHRPIEAGLLGVDTLLVNDEAHLSTAFAQLLREIERQNPAGRIQGKAFRVLLLSATQDACGWRRFDHDCEVDARVSAHFHRIFHAPKSLHLHKVERKARENTIWKAATETPTGRTLVFIETPEAAASFCGRLKKDGKRATLLTGTMRGWERDQLANRDEVFRIFLEPEEPAEPAWLVSTSAGEVGVNLTCERLVTELVEADHLLQRFGRLNRFGGPKGEAHVVYSEFKPGRDDRLSATETYLQSLEGDVSCARIWSRQAPKEACAESPRVARFAPGLIDGWAQTSHRDSSLPRVAPWLHGQVDPGAPETEVAWREDLATLLDWGIAPEQIEKVLEAYPVRSTEKLSEPATRVWDKLAELGQLPEYAQGSLQIVEVDADKTVRIRRLAEIIGAGRGRRDQPPDIAYKLLILPLGVGSIENGMFRPERPADNVVFDVADRVLLPEDSQARDRARYVIDGDSWRRVGGGESFEMPSEPGELELFAKEHGYRYPLLIQNPTQDSSFLAYFAPASKLAFKRTKVLLDKHAAEVERTARELAVKCGVPQIAEVYAAAGRDHDAGKANSLWQKAMGATQGELIAKSDMPANVGLINGYRHELGSLLRTQASDDLVLHLIASHHAGARPFFEQRQYERDQLSQSGKAAHAAALRYARLTRRFGPWGLAYLEAIFKCADGIVSEREGEPASE